MKLSIQEAQTNFSEIVQEIIDGKEEYVIISKNGKPVVKILPIENKNFKRIGVAKKEMEGFSISLEEFNSIPVGEF